jgi:hypothetical protein
MATTMKYLKPFLLTLIIFLATFCSQNSPETKQEKFRKFISKQKPIHINYRYRVFWDDIKNLFTVDSDSTDNEFLDDRAILGGYLPDTSRSFAVLVFYQGDDLVPRFYLYDKSGNRTDTLDVAFGDDNAVYSPDSCRYYFAVTDSFKITKEKQCSIDSFKANTFISSWDYYIIGNKFKLNIETEKKQSN